jgi:hypothetical protein
MILVKIYGDKKWSNLTFGNRLITDFNTAMDIAQLTRLRCKLKLVENGFTTHKWNNL